MYLRKKGRSKNSVDFNPNSDYVEKAVADFLKKGGKIKKPEVNDYNTFMSFPNLGLADQYLLGRE